jgi:hypothetical protein
MCSRRRNYFARLWIAVRPFSKTVPTAYGVLLCLSAAFTLVSRTLGLQCTVLLTQRMFCLPWTLRFPLVVASNVCMHVSQESLPASSLFACCDVAVRGLQITSVGALELCMRRLCMWFMQAGERFFVTLCRAQKRTYMRATQDTPALLKHRACRLGSGQFL